VSQKITENFTYGQVSVGTVPTAIGVPGVGRDSITIVNGSAVAVYLGDANVTVGTGVLLAPTLGAQMNLTTTGTVYGVSVAGSAPVSFIDCN